VGNYDNAVFAVEQKGKREEYLLKLLADEHFAVPYGDEKEFKGSKVYVMSIVSEVDRDTAVRFEPGSVLFARGLSEEVKELLASNNIAYFNYNANETLIVKNAALTAEGALSMLIQNTETTIKNMRTLVLGYGRVGKAVVKSLQDNYVSVTVATDNELEYALASIFADRVYAFDKLPEIIKGAEAIINTVPVKILKGEILGQIGQNCFVLDLASKPGGLDYEYASKLNLNVLHALGVPSKYAPKTAATYIKQYITDSLHII